MSDMQRRRTDGRRPVRLAACLAVLAVAACAGPHRAAPQAPTQTDQQGGQRASFAAYAVAAQRALEYLPDQASARWTDPADGRVLHLTVLATEIGAGGLVCRHVRVTADGGETTQKFCRDAGSGRWQYAAA